MSIITVYSQRLPILRKLHELEFPRDDIERGECFCPSHDDGQKKGKKSLHVKVKEGDDGQLKVLLHCLAGCSTDQILSAIGCQKRDLFEMKGNRDRSSGENSKSRGNGRSRIVAVYDYRDEHGKILHQTVREDPKAFKQWRASFEGEEVTVSPKYTARAWKSRNGDWKISTLKGIDPVPYHLPQMLKRPNCPILFCEGEKDADRLASLGFLTTTIPMGTGKWRECYAQYFKGRKVAIVPDEDRPRKNSRNPDDNPGLIGAKKIAKALLGVASVVGILRLPNVGGMLTPKYDATDVVEAVADEKQAKQLFTQELKELTPLSGPDDPQLADVGPEKPPPPTLKGPTGSGPDRPEGTPDDFSAGVKNYWMDDDVAFPLTIDQIQSQIFKTCDHWPRRIGGKLFYCAREKEPKNLTYPIEFLSRTPALLGWIGSKTGVPPDFQKGGNFHTKDEIFAELQRNARSYDGIEMYPHYPPHPKFYYACNDRDSLKSSRHGCLHELVGFFEPEEDIDASLILLLILTLFWGGAGGRRPFFVVTSMQGQGTGKTSFVELIAGLVGGVLSLSLDLRVEQIQTRLLSQEGRERRVVMLDNVRKLVVANPSIESMITAEQLSGRQLYQGEGKRANRIVYTAAMNDVALNTDLAQRSVIIRLRKPKFSGTWDSEIRQFMAEHHPSIIAEVLEMLAGPRCKIPICTRFGDWTSNVLCCLDQDTATEVQDAIVYRQRAVNADRQDGEEFEAMIERELRALNYDPEMDWVLIPRRTIAEWRSRDGETTSTANCTRLVNREISSGALKRLRSDDGCRTSKYRAFLWCGADAESPAQPYNDFPDRYENWRHEKGSEFDFGDIATRGEY